MSTPLPAPFETWFSGRGWQVHPHQYAMAEADGHGEHTLLIAPTGGGKTLAGFLPSLLSLAEGGAKGRLHTLYISPLKSLTADVQRNLTTPVLEIGLDISIEARTGDTPSHIRQRQKTRPPQILLTTPESLALMLSYKEAPRLFQYLERVVIDEIHAMAFGKRGDQLSLCLARLEQLAPGHRRSGLSATIDQPERLQRWLSAAPVTLVKGGEKLQPSIAILETDDPIPWSGHSCRYAFPAVYEAIQTAKTTIVFVNTRAQAEVAFQELWMLNEDDLPIALHHGSLSKERRQKVEAAMAAGQLRAVVATASLDLGVDWADVDLVIQLGAPKGVARMVQRIGRAGHRLDQSSRALLVPSNRFEVLECRAALDAIKAGDLDGPPLREGGLDVLAQHLLLIACQASFHPSAMLEEVRRAAPYERLAQEDFDATLAFVIDGGYALKAYEQWHRLVKDVEGRYAIASPKVARRVRMNVGTIVESETLNVRLNRGKYLGQIEEYFVQGLTPGDTFLFAGEVVKYEGLREMTVMVSRTYVKEPKVPSYQGGKFPLSEYLADRVQQMIADAPNWMRLPMPVRDWLWMQGRVSALPRPDRVLAESFPRHNKHYFVLYSFAGRNAHQTLGLLLTHRMNALRLGPIGFVGTDYCLMIWSVRPVIHAREVLNHDLLEGDLHAWLAESSLLKRTFRNVGVIAGLIERNHPGQKKSGRQVTVNSDLIYDTLRKYEPEHILLRATWNDAMTGLVDLDRVKQFVDACSSRLEHKRLDRVSPMAVPVLLEVNKQNVGGEAEDILFEELEEELLAEVGLSD